MIVLLRILLLKEAKMHDDDTSISRQILKVLAANHPSRIALAYCAATFVKLGAKIWIKYYDYAWLKVINESSTLEIWLVIAGILLLPVVFGRGVASDDVKTQIDTVQALIDAAGLTKPRAAIIWNALIDKYIKSVSVDLDKPERIDLFAEARQELSDAQK